MKISELVDALEHIKADKGDIEVALHDSKSDDENYAPTSCADFFVEVEHYTDESWRVRLSSWPY